jgi:hypothetical protein
MRTYDTHHPLLEAHHYLIFSGAFLIAAAGYGLWRTAHAGLPVIAPIFWWFWNARNLAQLIVGFIILTIAVGFPRFVHRPVVIVIGMISIIFGVAATFGGIMSGPLEEKITMVMCYVIGSLACFAIVPSEENKPPHHPKIV